jgi:hypothetical protein
MANSFEMTHFRPARAAALPLVVAVLVALAFPITASAASPKGSPNGWVRLGHLSPNTPAVDIYLAPFGKAERVVFRKAGYGNVTPYSALAPGTYTVSMRPASAPADSPAALSANVQVKAGTSSTMMVFQNGPNGTIRGQLFTDDLTPPAQGSGLVRVVQGAPEPATLTVAGAQGGATLADNLKYGDASRYITLPKGQQSLVLRSGSTTTPVTVDVTAGSVSTVVVINKPGGGLTAKQLRDSTAVAAAPTGAANTGGGGTATQPVLTLTSALAALAVGTLSVLLVLGSRPRHDREIRV